VNASHRSRAFTALKKGILRVSKRLPAETAFPVVFIVILIRVHDGFFDFLKLLKEGVVGLVKN